MSDFTEGGPMIEELAYTRKLMPRSEQELLDEPSAFFRGTLIAVAVGMPVWSGLIWGVTKLA